jgi:hypothetical protein
MAKLSFDATKVEPAQTYGALPAGRYEVIIADTEIKPTKAGTGEYLQITFDVTGPTQVGRKVWGRYNISNPNKTAEEIAMRELSAICHAVDLPMIEDSDELIDKCLEIDVAIEINPATGAETNRIKGYVQPDRASAPATQAAPPAEPRAARPATPWAKR